MDETFKLANDEHEWGYDRIEKFAFENTRPAKNPRIIILGGQPGSGKSLLLTDARKEFLDGNVVVINGDDLRNDHPKADEILKLDDKLFAERTDPDSRIWTKRLFDKAITTRRNIVFESTMREVEPLRQTMQNLREHGYHITARVIATHERFSLTGIYYRYEIQKAEKKYGRYTSKASHDAGFVGMPKTVKQIETNKLVDVLEVYSRSREIIYENVLMQNEWRDSPKAVNAIESERLRQPSHFEIEQLEFDWKYIHKQMLDRHAPSLEIDHVIKVRDILDLQTKTPHKPRKRITIRDSFGKAVSFSEKSHLEDLIMLRKRTRIGENQLVPQDRELLDQWILAKRKDVQKPKEKKKGKSPGI